jgi:hypothetical protein
VICAFKEIQQKNIEATVTTVFIRVSLAPKYIARDSIQKRAAGLFPRWSPASLPFSWRDMRAVSPQLPNLGPLSRSFFAGATSAAGRAKIPPERAY